MDRNSRPPPFTRAASASSDQPLRRRPGNSFGVIPAGWVTLTEFHAAHPEHRRIARYLVWSLARFGVTRRGELAIFEQELVTACEKASQDKAQLRALFALWCDDREAPQG